MTAPAVCLAKKKDLPTLFSLRRLPWIEFPINAQFRGWRKIEKGHELCHKMDLTSPFKNVDTFFGRDYRIAIEIGRPLFEFSEILDRFHGTLGPKEALDIHPS